MIHIPTEEIKQPRLHADTLGFTFVWKGHFLRGIYPGSEKQATSYFESGFLDEVVNKGLFPKTWISEFENEQFCMIIEHEMISPMLFATEWNSAMLKDAALMVLDIAEVGWKHGYNMVDCHKLNVMFKINRPVYVDLGSFVPRESGSTGWKPYTSFLRSYYFILKMWTSGVPTLAKRMMAPGLEMPEKEYYAYESRLYRLLPSLIKTKMYIQNGISSLAASGNIAVSKHGSFAIFLKSLVNTFKLSPSQHLEGIKRKISKIKIKANQPLQDEQEDKINAFLEIMTSRFQEIQSVTFIDNERSGYYDCLSKISQLMRIISIQQDDSISSREYRHSKPAWGLTSANIRLLNNSILMRNKLPESRLCSDIAVIPSLTVKAGVFGIHNSLVFIENCLLYSRLAIIIGVEGNIHVLQEQLKKKYSVDVFSFDEKKAKVFLIVYPTNIIK